MRGKGPHIKISWQMDGITPAYAGKSIVVIVIFYPLMGSPPRMRGKEAELQTAIEQIRITPAYAGKSMMSYFLRAFTWDHPRVCGEKSPV